MGQIGFCLRERLLITAYQQSLRTAGRLSESPCNKLPGAETLKRTLSEPALNKSERRDVAVFCFVSDSAVVLTEA